MAWAYIENLPLCFTYTRLYILMSTVAKVLQILEHRKSTVETF